MKRHGDKVESKKGEQSNRAFGEKTGGASARQANAAAIPLPDPAKPLAEQAPAVLLAMCVFGEARGQSQRAQRAVAQVVINRARHPHAVFGSRAELSIEDNLRRVILRRAQFSSFDPRDPNYPKLLRPLDHEPPAVWERCWQCAQEALAAAQQEDTLTSNSDHYFDDSIAPPSWADPAHRTVTLDRLSFYRLYLPPPRKQQRSFGARFSESSDAAAGTLSPGSGPAQEFPASPPQPPCHSAPEVPGDGPRLRRATQPIAAGPTSLADTFCRGLAATPQLWVARRSPSLGRRARPLVSLPAPAPQCTRIHGIIAKCREIGSRRLSRQAPELEIRAATGRERSVGGDRPLATARGSDGRLRFLLRTAHRKGLLALLPLCLLLAACSDLERTAYRTLAVTRAEYELIQQQVAEEAVHGRITEEQWDRFQVQGHRFIAAYNMAVDAFELWSRAKDEQNAARLESVLEKLPQLLQDLRALVQSFEKQRDPASEPRPEGSGPEEGSPKTEVRSQHPSRARPGFGPLQAVIGSAASAAPASSRSRL